MCTCIFKSLAFSINLSLYNAYAGYSGLQMIDSVLWMTYNVCLTNVQMSQCFLFDQDVPMDCAAKTNEESFVGRKKEDLTKSQSEKQPTVSIYDTETEEVGYSVAEYYAFTRENYQKTILKRILAYELISVWASFVSYYIPFQAYGLGIANSSGKTEDLFAASLAVYAVNIFMHHFQMYITIRNYSKWFAITCPVSIMVFYPFFLIAADTVGESMYGRIWEITGEQWVLFYGTVIISTFIAVIPIYLCKVYKMTCYAPKYF